MVAGGGSEHSIVVYHLDLTEAQPLLSILEGLSSEISPLVGCNTGSECHGVQETLQLDKGAHVSHAAAGKPLFITHRCPLIMWQGDAIRKAPVLESTQHPSGSAAKGLLRRAGRLCEGSSE